MEFIRSTLTSRWPELLGLLLTLGSGFLVPWISKKSGNYKKLNWRMVRIGLLHLIYVSIIPILISVIGVFVLAVAVEVAGKPISLTAAIASYMVMAVVSLAIYFAVMGLSKRMRLLRDRAKEKSRWLYPMLQWVVVISIVLSFFNLLFVGSPYEDVVAFPVLVISWILQFWWLYIVAAVVWKTSDYVYANIKITMLDGEVFNFDCSPKVCRVYRNYIRILKRDEKGAVVQELQINEAAIRQIEYSK
jgi:hypothetical protein